MTRHRLSPVLLDLYRCPTDGTRWPAVLDQICRTMRVRSAVVQLVVGGEEHTRTRWMVRDSQSEAAREIHDRYFSDAVNPRMRVLNQRPWREPQAILRDTDIFDTADPLYADLQRRLAAVRFGFFISVRIALSDNEALALVLHRDCLDRRDFDSRDERFALQFMPHLRQAVQLTNALHQSGERARDLSETLNQLRSAVLLCSGGGTVCWMNQAAEHILSQRECLWLSGGRLTGASPQETGRLRRIIAEAAEESSRRRHSAPRLLVLRGQAGCSELQVRIQAIGAPNGAEPGDSNSPALPAGRVLLLLSDPGAHPALPAGLLGSLFALSPAESRLAAALTRGQTLNEYALEHDLSVGTVRYQLKQVMSKTQVSRQSELIQRLYSSVIAHTVTCS